MLLEIVLLATAVIAGSVVVARAIRRIGRGEDPRPQRQVRADKPHVRSDHPHLKVHRPDADILRRPESDLF